MEQRKNMNTRAEKVGESAAPLLGNDGQTLGNDCQIEGMS